MQQQQNYLGQSVIGTSIVVAVLLLLVGIPEFDLGSFHFKRIDLLSDIIKKEDKLIVPVDTAKIIKPVYADTCKTGITCIEDYSKDTSGMNTFLSALDSSGNRLVRIAWFADSYVEGDIMLDPLRDSMQTIFGGSGVGFLPITSEVAGFRQTVIHSFDNWKTYSIVGDKDDEHPLGFGGYNAVPQKGNIVRYKAIGRKRLNNFPTTKIFYGNTEGGQLYVNDDTIEAAANKRLGMISLNHQMPALELSVPAENKIDMYGVSFEDTKGIDIDNFSMRGNSGIGLAKVSEQMYRDLDSIHPYALVVISYGLNVASEKAKNYDWYVKSMDKVVASIRRSFPHSSILMIGCSDRAAKVDGEMQTMPMLKELIDEQRKMAINNQVCFWNLFDAMGGDSTMVKWADMPKHAYANKDYTHLTFYGGKKVADILLGTLLYEKQKYDRRKRSL